MTDTPVDLTPFKLFILESDGERAWNWLNKPYPGIAIWYEANPHPKVKRRTWSVPAFDEEGHSVPAPDPAAEIIPSIVITDPALVAVMVYKPYAVITNLEYHKDRMGNPTLAAKTHRKIRELLAVAGEQAVAAVNYSQKRAQILKVSSVTPINDWMKAKNASIPKNTFDVHSSGSGIPESNLPADFRSVG